NVRRQPDEIADVRARRWRDARLRHGRLRNRRGRDHHQESAVAGDGRYDRREPDRELGSRRTDPDARRRDPCIQRRARFGCAPMSVETVTLGCRLNFAESETIAPSAPADEDWIVVNSCAVTNEAVRQTRQAVRRAHRRGPDARILVTGCAAELEPETFASMPGVWRVIGNAGKLSAFLPIRHPGLDPGPAFSTATSKRRQTPAL